LKDADEEIPVETPLDEEVPGTQLQPQSTVPSEWEGINPDVIMKCLKAIQPEMLQPLELCK
jgi:hypothetical protein